MGRSLVIIGMAAVLAACTETSVSVETGDGDPGPAIDLARVEVVDLTHTYDETTIYWPTDTKGFRLNEEAHGHTEGGWFYSAYSFSTAEHGGTHMDAPIHFDENGVTADAIPVDRLVGPAVVIDVKDKAAADPDYRLTAEDVTAFEAEHGEIAPGTIVLLNTGWSQRWPDRKAYLGDDRPGMTDALHFPSFGEDSARLLVEARKVAVIGLDTASIDYGQSADFIVHRIAGSHNVPGLENLKDLDRLPPTGATVIALPMKIGGGSGAPVRVIAFIPKDE